MGLVARGTNPVIEGLELSVRPLTSEGKGEGQEAESITNGQGFDQSCLGYEASIKPQKNQF